MQVITSEENVEFDDLPQDVRELCLRTGNDKIEFDFLDARDKEMQMVI